MASSKTPRENFSAGSIVHPVFLLLQGRRPERDRAGRLQRLQCRIGEGQRLDEVVELQAVRLGIASRKKPSAPAKATVLKATLSALSAPFDRRVSMC
jgi:hypothetical protein